MARPRQGYRLADGTPVPGVTTILRQLGDDAKNNALMGWAAKLAREGKDFRKERDLGMAAGSALHALIEADLLNGPAPDLSQVPAKQMERAALAFGQYADWRRDKSISPLLMEEPLVSERCRFGGTPDLVAWVGMDLVVVDWKISKSLFLDATYPIQLAAYRYLFEEAHPDENVSGARLVMFGEDDCRDTAYTAEQLDIGWQIFQQLLPLPDLRRRLEDAA